MRVSSTISQLRDSQFDRLDATFTTYFDYTGAGLYPSSLIRSASERLLSTVLGNPHSDSDPSRISTHAIEEARAQVLEFVDADPKEYDVIFTANASSAIRIIAEAFPFEAGSRLVLTADNHNAVNGLRLPAERKSAKVEYVPLLEDLQLQDPLPWLKRTGRAPSLFAYPAQSNFSGRKHPLEWVSSASRAGYFVLLDAASYTPTNGLSLREISPDFVAISFYKMFGYPTGVGALIVKREALGCLSRDYFSGGTVQFVSLHNRMFRAKDGVEAYEDGTANYLAMPVITEGLRWLDSIGMEAVQSHVSSATAAILEGLKKLGEAVRIYGPQGMEERGGTIAFNLYDGDSPIAYELIERAARERGIALRGGCFCNPGAAETAFGMGSDNLKHCLEGPFSMRRLRQFTGGPVGAVRVSSGIATNTKDIATLLQFLSDVVASKCECWRPC